MESAMGSFPTRGMAVEKLTQARKYEYEDEKRKFEKLCEVEHSVRFILSEGHIVASITLARDALAAGSGTGLAVRIKSGTPVKWKWRSGNLTFDASGVTDDLPLFIQDCDIAILVLDGDIWSFLGGPDLGGKMVDRKDLKSSILERGIRQNMCKEFEPMSHLSKWERKAWLPRAYSVELDFQANDTIYKDNINALELLASARDAWWIPYLLTQRGDLDNLPSHDSTTAKPSDVTQETWDQSLDDLYGYLRIGNLSQMPGFEWNSGQMEVLDRIKSNKGKILCIGGPAGTGKTEMTLQLGYFFYRLGYHVLFNAPANQNVEDYCHRMSLRYGEDLPYVRLTPRSASRDVATIDQDEDKPQPSINEVKEKNEISAHLSQKMKDRAKKYSDSNAFHLPSLAVKAADGDKLGRHVCSITIDDDDEPSIKPPSAEQLHNIPTVVVSTSELGGLPADRSCKIYKGVPVFIGPAQWQISTTDPRYHRRHDIWEVMRAFLKKARGTPMKQWFIKDSNGEVVEDVVSKKAYRDVSKLCQELVLAHSRFVCATSAIASGKMMREVFASGKLGSKQCTGLIVITDEAAKDIEPNFWGPIVQKGWSKKIQLVIACGDEKQLSPPVFSNEDSNPLIEQLKLSFFSRFIHQGGSFVQLTEQNRMHVSIADIPSQLVYSGKLTTPESRCLELDDDIPGLVDALKPLFLDLGVDADSLHDWQLRVRAFRMDDSSVELNKKTKSKYNPDQIQFAIDWILPHQMKFFGKKTFEKCLWIAGYGEHVAALQREFFAVQSDKRVSRDYLPRIQTIDSSQGTEAEWVILFSVCTEAGRRGLGFMADDRRMTVAITRAKNLFWYIHGEFYLPKDVVPEYMVVAYAKECDKRNMTTSVDLEKLPKKA